MNQEGFSLLEVLIALALLSTALLIADFSLSQTLNTNAHISAHYVSMFAVAG